MDDTEYHKACLKIHGYNFSSEDEDKSESDEESRKLRPPPIPYEAFKDKIIKLDPNNIAIQSHAVASNPSVVNQNKKKSRSKKTKTAQIDNSTPSNVPKKNPQELVKEVPQYLHGNRNQIKDTIFTTESSATAYNLQRSLSTQFTPTVPNREYIITNASSFMQIEYTEGPVSNSFNNLNCRPINYAGVLNSPIINPGRNEISVVEQPSAAPNAQRNLQHNIDSNRFTPNIPTERDLCSSIGNVGNIGGSLTRGVDNTSRSLCERSATNMPENDSLHNQNTIIQTQQNESVTLPSHDNDDILLFERGDRSCCNCCTIS